ncbi:hypothetical protein STEG23_002841 [Scotinomys teguina]
MALRSRPDQLLKIPKDLLNQHSSPPTSNRPPSASLCIFCQVLAIFTFSFIPPYPEDCDHYDPLHRRKNAGLRIDMELFMKFFRWQRSLRTEGIEGTGGCINNSIALCQRTRSACPKNQLHHYFLVQFRIHTEKPQVQDEMAKEEEGTLDCNSNQNTAERRRSLWYATQYSMDERKLLSMTQDDYKPSDVSISLEVSFVLINVSHYPGTYFSLFQLVRSAGDHEWQPVDYHTIHPSLPLENGPAKTDLYTTPQYWWDASEESSVDTGADVTIIAPEFWYPNWPVQEVNVQLLGIGTLSQVKQSARWLECIGPEGQRAKLKPYVANIAMNLWGRDLLKQWNTQINIPPVSETNQLTHVSERNTRRYYSNHWSPAIQIVQEQGRTTVDLPKTPTALPLKWLTDKPVWVQQWPLTTEKLQALEELVQEQLNAQHIEESTSPWNSPVFVIKKKSGKWRMVTDLRAINKVIQPMGSLQSGIPLPTLLPKGWPLIVIDLKDCFFSIPLQEKDRERFAFTVPTYNNSQPVKRYQWRVLPQGMLNSPTLCQYFVQQPLEVIRKKFPKSIIYHYMDDILLADSNADTLERLFEEVKKILPCWGLQIAPEKIQKGDSINYLGYKIGLQKIRPQKVQIRRDRLRTLNDFQRLFGDISHLRTITGVKNDELSNLFKTLEGDKDLNSPRELTPEAEKELALVEKKVQDGHVDRVDPKLDCILVILPSRHSPTGILMQREDIILEWIFLPNKQSKKLKTYVEKISDLILKGKLRLRQLAGIDPAEIVVPLTKEEIEKLWAESEPWQRACSNFLGEINSKYPKSDRIELIKRADWILPRIVRETPISGVRTFYTDANKQGKAGYKSEDLSKVVQSPYNSVQKSELYAILLVLMDFSEPLNIVTDSQYAERVVLHIETAEFIPDESELTSLFIQLQDIIRNRKHPLYITHIRSHTGLPGPLAQGNDEIDKLLIGNVLEASEFHKKHHVNSKGLKRDFSITWQQAKEIVRKCPTCSFYNQTPLPAGCNPKGTQRNDIWQMDVFHFAEFGKLKYVHHTIDTYSGFQWATALSSEKADSVITHLLEVMAIMGIPAQIKTDNAPAYVSGKMKQFFAYYNIKHITDNEDLWIASRLIWFDQPRPPDSSSDVPKSRSASRQLAQKMKPHRLLQSGLDHNTKVFFVSPLRTQRPLYQQEVA